MTQETAARLVEENLTAIYGYAYGKLYNKTEAEDLSQEIVLEILRSAENLQSDAAFWGFAWRIAENTFRKFIKRRALISQSVSLEAANLVEVLASSEADDNDDRDELIYRLRRELSLLGKIHREICVSYYLHNKSCSSIAKEQNISAQMVKQHLFKARKRLKEGMEMERKLGEKSYNPGTFRLDFWGDRNYYAGICDKKLPGAILLTAYNHPFTAEELSVELGVAMPYLEDDLERLEASGLLLKNGKKYETNIIIITDAYEKEFVKQTRDGYMQVANAVFDHIKSKLSEIRALDFHGNDYDDNSLLFSIINIALVRGYEWTKYCNPPSEAPRLALGGRGWVFGYDNNYENHHFLGITLRSYNKERSAWFSAENYRVTLPTQFFKHRNFDKRIEAMCDAILEKDTDVTNETLPDLIESGIVTTKNGRLSAAFVTFEDEVYKQLLDILKPAYEAVADCMIKISDNAASLLAKTVPVRLRSQCVDIAKIHHRLDVAAFVMETLIEQGALTLPKEKTPICVYGVKM